MAEVVNGLAQVRYVVVAVEYCIRGASECVHAAEGICTRYRYAIVACRPMYRYMPHRYGENKKNRDGS